MKQYEIRFTKEAVKDVKKLAPRLKKKLIDILHNAIANDPKSGKPLVRDLQGFYSRRLTYKDRIVYSTDDKQRVVFIHRAKTHYGE